MNAVADRLSGVSGAMAFKVPVLVATTENISLTGLQTIDDVSLTEGVRVLVKDQTTPRENGIYNVSSGAWRRSEDFDGARDIVRGSLVFVVAGTANGTKQYYVSVANPVIGTSDLSFGQFAPDANTGGEPTGVTVSPAMQPVVEALNLNLARQAFGSSAIGDALFTALNTTVAQVALGLVPGIQIQAFSDLLSSIAGATIASGDLLVGSDATNFARLPRGTAGQLLRVNDAGTALEWGAGPTAFASIDLVGENTVEILSGLPASTYKIVLHFVNLSTSNSGSQPILQLGSVLDGGYLSTPGDYVSNSVLSNGSALGNINTGMIINTSTFGNTYWTMTLDRSATGWHASHIGRAQSNVPGHGYGYIGFDRITGDLDRVRITLTNTSFAFDSTSLVSGRYWS